MKAEVHWNCSKAIYIYIYSAVLHSLSSPTYWKEYNCKQELKHASTLGESWEQLMCIYKLAMKVKCTAYTVLHLLLHAEGPQSTPSPYVWKLSWLTSSRLMTNSIFFHQCLVLTRNRPSKWVHRRQRFSMLYILIINYTALKMVLPGLLCTNAESTPNISKGKFTHSSSSTPLILQAEEAGMLCYQHAH